MMKQPGAWAIGTESVRMLELGHPWIIADAFTKQWPKGKAGDLMELTDDTGRFLATALLDPDDRIVARVLARERIRLDRAWAMKRLHPALQLRRAHADLGDTNAYRLVNGEGDGMPGLTVDRYGEHLLVQLYSAGWEPHLKTVIQALQELVDPGGIYVKGRPQRTRELEALSDTKRYGRLLAGAPAPAGLSADERRAYEALVRTFKQVDYARLMGSRPQTLYGIADSPVGLAAWLLDHNDADGQPAAAVVSALDRTTSDTGELTRDEILDNITLYWLTNTGVSASRLYWEYKGGFFNAKGVSTPVAVSVFPGEQYEAPRSWTERAYPKLIHYNKLDKGGHFAAWEEPWLFAAELRAAFRSLRQ